MQRLWLAYICAVANAAIIGFSFLFTKQALESASPMDTLAFRFIASFAVMTIPVAFGWIKLDYKGKPLGKLLLLALFYPASFFALQAFGLVHASSAEGGILYAFTPVLTTLLASAVLKERTNGKQKLALLLSAFGVVFIFAMKGSGIELKSMTGIALLFMSCLTFAGYGVLARSLTKQFRPTELSYATLGFGFVTFLAFSVWGHVSNGTLSGYFSPLADGKFLIAILFLGVISSLITSLLSNYVLSKLEASKMSVFSNLSTVVSIAAGALFLGEEITVYHLIGSVLIIAGVIGMNRFGRSKQGAPKPAVSAGKTA
ncbi:DMT family transporter [Paenibacillus sp. MBLB4367]|uniref:DMT family transporter n=1 Tax=Paenibacillus sp. MBLB4367 TaxID=3384767 RepID=UPI0039082837